MMARNEVTVKLADVPQIRGALEAAKDEAHRLGEIARLSDSMRDQFRIELERTEGDLAVAVREAARAREVLRLVRPVLASYVNLGYRMHLPFNDQNVDEALHAVDEALGAGR